jgi:hypothetical protein
MRRIAGASALILLLAADALADPGFVDIEVTATPIETFTIAAPVSGYGEIQFRGGLVLRSPYSYFGAVSGLDITQDGRLLAVTDTGFWLTGTIVEDEDGWLRGLSTVAMAPILDEAGDEANRKSSADAEGLRFDPLTGTVLVSFEQQHRVSRFDAADLGAALPTPVALPALTGLRGNRGIEAVAIAPPGSPLGDAIVILSEDADAGAEGIRGWVVGGPQAGSFFVSRNDQFAITDAAFLPNGDLLILERLFSLSEGIGVRIRRLSADDMRPGRVVDGPVILFDDHLFQIDNMEGMAVRPLPNGEVLITLISDDNHSLLQRTILLQFLWRETIPPEPTPRP